jgi:RNA polymerase sigma-70 factor, ECF subfamily
MTAASEKAIKESGRPSGRSDCRSSPQPSDEELYAQFRGGARDAFDHLVHRYEGELFRYLRRYIGDADLAEDVFQATFLDVFRKAKLFDPQRRFRSWLYSIATHRAIDRLRSRGRQPAVSLERKPADADEEATGPSSLVRSKDATPVNEAIDEEQRRWIRESVDALPEHLRSVVMLVYFQGLTYGETAEALGVPLGTVKSRMHAAFQKLGAARRRQPTSSQVRPRAASGSGDEPVPRPEAEKRSAASEPPVLDFLHATMASLAAGEAQTAPPGGLARSTCLRLREQTHLIQERQE